GNPTPAYGYSCAGIDSAPQRRSAMALYVGLDVSLKTTSICIVAADGSAHWEGKAESEPASLVKALTRWRAEIALVGIEACPLSEWLYGALVESGFQTV